MLKSYTRNISSTLITDICLSLNWWILSLFSPILILPTIYLQRNLFISLSLYVIFIVINESTNNFYYTGDIDLYILFTRIPDDSIFYLVFNKYIIFFTRYFIYAFTILSYLLNRYNRFNTPLKILYPMIVTSSMILLFMITVISEFDWLRSLESDNFNFRYLINIVIAIQPHIIITNILSIWQNYNNLKNDLTNPEIIESIKKETCHPNRFTNADLLSDFSNVILAGSFILIMYLNALGFIFGLLMSYNVTRNYVFYTIGTFIITLMMRKVFDFASNYCCVNRTLIDMINYISMVSCMTFAIRLERMIYQCFINLLKVPLKVLDLKNTIYYKHFLYTMHSEYELIELV